MNFKKLNKVFKYFLLTFTILLLFSLVGCDRNVEPVNTSEVSITVVDGTNLVDSMYIISNVNTSTTTSTTSITTLTTDSETTTITTINEDVDTIIDDTELEDDNNTITPNNSNSNNSSPQTIELLSPKKTTITEKINKANSTTSTTSIKTIATTEEVTTTSITTESPQNSIVTEFVKTFSRGTYYCYGRQCVGGSSRSLINCSIGNGVVKGSIASSYLYNNYGYSYCGKRTMVYLEIRDYPSMNGYYYLDDCDIGNPNVIDFYYVYDSECPFRMAGVVTVDCYICKY